MSSRIEQIIEEIEEYIDRDCKFQPLSTTKIIVNKEHLEELLRELRLKTPDEIKRYQKIIANRDAILAEEELWLPDWSGLSELSGLSEPSGLSEFSGLSSAGGAALLISNVRDAGAGVLYLDSHVLNSPKSNSALIVWVPTNDSPGFVHLSTAVPSSPTETISASGFSLS